MEERLKCRIKRGENTRRRYTAVMLYPSSSSAVARSSLFDTLQVGILEGKTSTAPHLPLISKKWTGHPAKCGKSKFATIRVFSKTAVPANPAHPKLDASAGKWGLPAVSLGAERKVPIMEKVQSGH